MFERAVLILALFIAVASFAASKVNSLPRNPFPTLAYVLAK